MAPRPTTGIARRRATLRRGVIATLVVVCLALFSGYFREADDGPLHGVQATAAGVVAPVQNIASEAIRPFRDAWGWMTSLKDARDRAARLEEEVEELRGAAIENRVRDEELARLRSLVGVGRELDQYEPVVGSVITRSFTPWYRSARLDVGRDQGVMVNSPVVAGSSQGAALVGVVTSAGAQSADVAFITDGQTEVGATVPEADSPPGVLESTVPGQLQLTGIPRDYPVREGQAVVTAGFGRRQLPSVYPYGIPVGQVTSVGGTEVDAERTVQVTPYADPRSLVDMVVLAPDGPRAIRRAEG